MKYIFQLPAISVLTALALSPTLIQSQSAQAAYFTFSFSDDYNSQGLLYLSVSPLKGVGTETISLGELNDYVDNLISSGYQFPDDISSTIPQFYYNYTTYNPLGTSIDGLYYVNFYSNYDYDTVFTFQSGQLVGIDLSDAGSTFVSGGRSQYGDFFYNSSSTGTLSLSLQGDRYATSLDVEETVNRGEYIPVWDDEGNLSFEERVTTEVYNYSYSPKYGDLIFTTIDPIPTAIPEPLTMLGVGTACGFGSFFKRQLKRKKKAV